MTAPSIEQLKASSAPTESLLHFLLQVPGSMEAQIFYALVIGSALGLIAHYVRRWAEGEIGGSLISYLVCQNPRRSLLSVIAIISWSLAEVGSGLFTTDAGAFVGWALVILSGVKTGYAGDSLINKSTRPVWTEQKRGAVATVAAEVSKEDNAPPPRT